MRFYLQESKVEIQAFIDKFGQDRYDKFSQLKDRIRNFDKVDLSYHTKHTDTEKMDNILNTAENKNYNDFDIEGRPIPKPVNTKELVVDNPEGDKLYFITDVSDMIDVSSKKYGNKVGQWCIAGRYETGGQVKVSQANEFFYNYLRGLYPRGYYVIITRSGRKYCALMNQGCLESIWNDKDVELTNQFYSLNFDPEIYTALGDGQFSRHELQLINFITDEYYQDTFQIPLYKLTSTSLLNADTPTEKLFAILDKWCNRDITSEEAFDCITQEFPVQNLANSELISNDIPVTMQNIANNLKIKIPKLYTLEWQFVLANIMSASNFFRDTSDVVKLMFGDVGFEIDLDSGILCGVCTKGIIRGAIKNAIKQLRTDNPRVFQLPCSQENYKIVLTAIQDKLKESESIPEDCDGCEIELSALLEYCRIDWLSKLYVEIQKYCYDQFVIYATEKPELLNKIYRYSQQQS